MWEKQDEFSRYWPFVKLAHTLAYSKWQTICITWFLFLFTLLENHTSLSYEYYERWLAIHFIIYSANVLNCAQHIRFDGLFLQTIIFILMLIITVHFFYSHIFLFVNKPTKIWGKFLWNKPTVFHAKKKLPLADKLIRN